MLQELWRVVAKKNVGARLGPFHLNWPEPVFFGRPDRTNGSDLRTAYFLNYTSYCETQWQIQLLIVSSQSFVLFHSHKVPFDWCFTERDDEGEEQISKIDRKEKPRISEYCWRGRWSTGESALASGQRLRPVTVLTLVVRDGRNVIPVLMY